MNQIDQYTEMIITELENTNIFKNDPFLEKPRLIKNIKTFLSKKKVIELTDKEFNDIVFKTRYDAVEDTCINLSKKGLLKMGINEYGSIFFQKI